MAGYATRPEKLGCASFRAKFKLQHRCPLADQKNSLLVSRLRRQEQVFFTWTCCPVVLCGEGWFVQFWIGLTGCRGPVVACLQNCLPVVLKWKSGLAQICAKTQRRGLLSVSKDCCWGTLMISPAIDEVSVCWPSIAGEIIRSWKQSYPILKTSYRL